MKNIEDYLTAVDDYLEVAFTSDGTRDAYASNIKCFTEIFLEKLPIENDDE